MRLGAIMYLKYLISISGTLSLGNLWFQNNHKENKIYSKIYKDVIMAWNIDAWYMADII